MDCLSPWLTVFRKDRRHGTIDEAKTTKLDCPASAGAPPISQPDDSQFWRSSCRKGEMSKGWEVRGLGKKEQSRTRALLSSYQSPLTSTSWRTVGQQRPLLGRLYTHNNGWGNLATRIPAHTHTPERQKRCLSQAVLGPYYPCIPVLWSVGFHL